jgi:hypothetical protein
MSHLEATETRRPRDGRLSFVADLAFVLCAAWLVLWRIELLSSPAGSIWTSNWPALVVVGLLGASGLVGALQRQPRGFLPYALRWTLLGVVLVLPAWIALSILDAPAEISPRGVATRLRDEAQELMKSTSDTEEQEQLAQVIEHADAVDKLATVIDLAADRDVELPRVDLDSRPETAALDPSALPAETRDSLERALGLAEALESGRGLPEELTQEVGISDAEVQAAVIALLAVAIAPALGLSAPLVEALLSAIVADGTFSLSGLVHVGLALAMSTTASGKLSESKVKKNFTQVTDVANKGARLIEALEAKGGDKVRSSREIQLLKELSSEMAAQEFCKEETIRRARKITAGKPKREFKKQLKRDCPNTPPKKIDEYVTRYQ